MASEQQHLPPLPPELWEAIIEKMPHKHFLATRRLNQQFKQLVERTQRFKNITLSADVMNYVEVFKFGSRAGINMKRLKITELYPIINVEPRILNLNYTEYQNMFGKEKLDSLRKEMSAMKKYKNRGITYWNIKEGVSEKLKEYKESQIMNLFIRMPRETEEITIKGEELSYARRRAISAFGQANPVILAKLLNSFRELTLQNANMNASQYLEIFQQMGGSNTKVKKFVVDGQHIHNFLDVTGVNYTFFNIFDLFPIRTLCRAFLNVEKVELILKAKTDSYFDAFDCELRRLSKLKPDFSLKSFSMHMNVHYHFRPPWEAMGERKYFNEPIQNIQRKIHVSILNNPFTTKDRPSPAEAQSWHVLSRSVMLNTKNIESSCCAPRCTAFKIPEEIHKWTKELRQQAKNSSNSSIEAEDDLFLTGSTIPFMRKRITPFGTKSY